MPDQMNRLPPSALSPGSSHTASLVDILDRVLDKGLVVAGDIKISLAEVELLTIRIRLLICSIDKAEQIGLNWWRYDRSLVAHDETESTIARLEQRIAELERQLTVPANPAASSSSVPPPAHRS